MVDAYFEISYNMKYVECVYIVVVLFNLKNGVYMEKQFKVGGVSKSSGGQYKVRFATDMTRVKILAKTDSDINLVELPKALTKPELVSFLKTTELYANADYRAAIDAADAKYNGSVSSQGRQGQAKSRSDQGSCYQRSSS
jgi:hypothetical protein